MVYLILIKNIINQREHEYTQTYFNAVILFRPKVKAGFLILSNIMDAACL